MLNQSRVLNYIKDHLGFPFQQLELTDENLIEFVETYTLREFSYYISDVKKMNLNLLLDINKVPGRQNEYYLEEPEGLEILSVIEVYPGLEAYLIHGHPPLGAMSHGGLSDWALSVGMAMDVKMHSSYDITYEFMHPNILRISPVNPQNSTNVTVEYERQQPPDFRGIPNDLQLYFCKYALADIMIKLGRIRKKYADGQMHTPFGDIPISADILEEGKELKDKIEDRLKETYLPNVTIEFG